MTQFISGMIRHGRAVASRRPTPGPKATVQPLLINKDKAIAEYDPPRLSRGITTAGFRRQKQGSNRC